MPLSPSERKLRGKTGAHAMHAKHDSRKTSAPGRAAFMESFEDQVDPERRLPEKERNRRAAQARKAYFAGLALKSAKARRLRKEAPSSADDEPLDANDGPRRGRRSEPDHGYRRDLVEE